MLQEEVVKDSKLFKQQKTEKVKRSLEQLAMVQRDLQGCVMDLSKAKALYLESEQASGNG